ncbi:MAG: hypothetical protein ACE5F1_12400 [Planctomycetota bacterium]
MEITIALSIFIMGAVGFASSIVSSQAMRRTTSESGTASHDLREILAQFRSACSQDFNGAVNTYLNGSFPSSSLPGSQGSPTALITTRIILDETKLSPSLDLNGNLSVVDTMLNPATLNLAVLVATLSWKGPGGTMQRQATAYVARGEVGSSSASGGSAGQGSGGSAPPGSGGGTGSGGGGSGGSGAGGSGSASLSLASAALTGKNKDSLTATLNIDSPSDLQVVAVTMASSLPAFLKEIKVAGVKVFSEKNNPPATGTMVNTSPFTLDQSMPAVFDKFKFVSSSDGSGKPDMSGTSFVLRLHLEDGSSVQIAIDTSGA